MVCVRSMSTAQAHTNTTCTIKNKLWLKMSAGDGKGTEKVLNKDISTSVKLPVPQGRLHTYTVKQLFIWRQFHTLGPTQLRNQLFKTDYCHRYPIMHIRTYVHMFVWLYDLEETSHLQLAKVMMSCDTANAYVGENRTSWPTRTADMADAWRSGVYTQFSTRISTTATKYRPCPFNIKIDSLLSSFIYLMICTTFSYMNAPCV